MKFKVAVIHSEVAFNSTYWKTSLNTAYVSDFQRNYILVNEYTQFSRKPHIHLQFISLQLLNFFKCIQQYVVSNNMFYGFFTQLNHLKLFVRIFIRTPWLCCALIFSIFFVANEDFDTIIAKIGTTTPGNSRWLCWLLTPLPNKTVVFIFWGEYVVPLPFLSKSNFHSFRYIVLVFSNFSIVNLFIWFFQE